MNYNELLDLYTKLETKYKQFAEECEELKDAIKIVKETMDTKKDEFDKDVFIVEKDQIFLLSIEEYHKYKDVIPHIQCWWWLRSPSRSSSNYAAHVDCDDIVCYNSHVSNINGVVRPVIQYNDNIITSSIGSRFAWNGVTWIIIDTEKALAIAEMPIGFEKFDDKSNNYATSHIRHWLLDWKSTHQIDAL